jgi:hypothetical protein
VSSFRVAARLKSRQYLEAGKARARERTSRNSLGCPKGLRVSSLQGAFSPICKGGVGSSRPYAAHVLVSLALCSGPFLCSRTTLVRRGMGQSVLLLECMEPETAVPWPALSSLKGGLYAPPSPRQLPRSSCCSRRRDVTDLALDENACLNSVNHPTLDPIRRRHDKDPASSSPHDTALLRHTPQPTQTPSLHHRQRRRQGQSC